MEKADRYLFRSPERMKNLSVFIHKLYIQLVFVIMFFPSLFHAPDDCSSILGNLYFLMSAFQPHTQISDKVRCRWVETAADGIVPPHLVPDTNTPLTISGTSILNRSLRVNTKHWRFRNPTPSNRSGAQKQNTFRGSLGDVKEQL